MTAPDSRGPAAEPAPGAPDLNPFATAEKLMAQWEARHAATAAGRRVVGPGVPQYLSHERCSEAGTAGPREHAPARSPRRRPPPDGHPHVTDLLAWVLPASGPDDRPGRGTAAR